MDNIPDIVDLVLYLLGALSLLTWTIMLFKFWEFRSNSVSNRRLSGHFSGLKQVDELPGVMSSESGTLAEVAGVAMEELKALEAATAALDAKDKRAMLHHAMRQQIHLCQARLENGMAVLASVGSTAPFIGLFGTVWGIMNALTSITATGSAGLDVVAGPIGEALIATALGIAAAIPAVLAYNYFLRKVRLAVTEMEHFADRYMHLVIRSRSGGL